MSKAAAFTSHEAQYETQAKQYLAETQKILRHLAAERQRYARRARPQVELLAEVKEILYGK